ncbi:MAG: glycoside hydrolase family 43 protein [Clostridia bacterium]|nr:glycoside hydrolase family 43 protein [Clostridia bacterium]
MAAYLFVHFTKENLGGEQVYFAASKDGLHWQDLNGGEPVLRSTLGEKGVRDPFIVRHPQSGMYHLIATDLCMQSRRDDWHGAVHAGSRDIIVWDSPDLVNWSAPRAITVAPENAGCTWAPEAIWDADKEAFLLFFASFIPNGSNVEPDGKHIIHAAYTRDFQAFTPCFRYIELPCSVIDTTIVHEDGMYYRFSKDEETKYIKVDKGASLTGEFTPVPCPVLDSMYGLEGPECYQLPDGRWCLICDQYAAHKGYLPIIIDDLKRMDPQPLQPGEYDLGGVLKRHGGVLRIDDEAYGRLVAHYGKA